MNAFAVVFVFAILAVAFAAVTLLAAKILRPSVPDPRKDSTYECGIPAVGTTEARLNIRFHAYALLFVLFDVEVLFVYPWAVSARDLGTFALAEMGVFLAILALGLAFAWRKGALTWE